ncbi:MAG: response regulator [Betaproteobacteria bacterium]|nr:response regulator [Betaproteobacteria bacterium]
MKRTFIMLLDPQIRKVLAIDDDLTTLTMITMSCRALQANIRLQTASTIERANWLCRQERFDLIILDHQLGTMSGLAWLDGIRSHLRPSTAIVVFSGELKSTDLPEYQRRGVLQVLCKRSLTLGMLGTTW